MTVKADIRNRALKRLGVLEAGETASAEDAADVDAIYTSVHAMLVRENLAVWGSGTTDTIPEQFVEPLVDLVAAKAGPEFSVAQLDGLSLRVIRDDAMRELRRMLAPDPTGRAVRINYF